MAVIPPDAGVRMRMQTEASLVQALAPVRPVPSDLPELVPGQVFAARIQEALPDNTYRALVAGRQLTLQLPESAEPGDTLELVLIDRTGRTLIAQRAEGQPAGTPPAQPYPYARISDVGRMIVQLLPREGESPPPAQLNQGQPVLPQPPLRGADLVPALARAVIQSGLFYESHQAQWLTGQRSLESLRAEPQGQLPPAATLPAGEGRGRMPPAGEPDARPASVAGEKAQPPAAGSPAVTGGQQPAEPGRVVVAATSVAGEAAQVAGGREPTATVPEQLRPLVQQQLDAITSQRLLWHGEVWPGQILDWAIERDQVAEREVAPAMDEAPAWSTSLRLTTPRLGGIDATLRVTGNRLSLQVTAAAVESAEDLRRHLPDLVHAMADAGVDMHSAEIRHEA